MPLTLQRLRELLTKFPQRTIGLVGDLFLDRYLEIAPGLTELSVETGLRAHQVANVRNSPGAVGTVLNNLAALRVGRLRPVTVIGDDGHGYDLLAALKQLPVDDDWIITDPARLTPTYIKPIEQDVAGRWRELNRLDVRSRCPLEPHSQHKLEENVREVFECSDGLIVLDQVNETGCGVVNKFIREVLADLATRWPEKLIFVDSRRHLGEFSHGILKGNRDELLAATNTSRSERGAVEAAAANLAARCHRPVFGTLGDEGILVSFPHGESFLSPSVPVDGPIDIVGAGDSATSGIVAGLLCGADEREAATIGNLVASITVQQLDTTGTASPEQVIERFQESEA